MADVSERDRLLSQGQSAVKVKGAIRARGECERERRYRQTTNIVGETLHIEPFVDHVGLRRDVQKSAGTREIDTQKKAEVEHVHCESARRVCQ